MTLRTSLLILAIISLVTIGGGGFFLATHLTSTAWDVARSHTEKTTEMIQQRISFSMTDKQLSTNALAKVPQFSRFLQQRNPSSSGDINRLLKKFCDNLSASLCYLMDPTGTTVGANNFDQQTSLLGINYSFRPYFKQAISGHSTVYLALGVTTKKRGFYFSAPIRGDNDTIIGVMVIKYAVEKIETEMSQLAGTFTLIDPNGVVFSSNRTEWLFHSLSKLSADDAHTIIQSRQFGEYKADSVGLTETPDGLLAAPDGTSYLFDQRNLPAPAGWSVHYLYDTDNVTTLLDQGVGGIPLKILFIILFPTIALIVIFLYSGASREIVKRHKAQAELRDSEEKYRLLFEKSEDPMWVIYDNLFMLANQAAARSLGYDSVTELTKIHPSKLSPEFQPGGIFSFEQANRMIQTAYRQGYHRFEWDHARKNGEVFPVEVSLTRIPFQHHDALYCVWRDISENKKAQHALETAKQDAERATRTKSEFLANMSHEIRTPMNAILGMTSLALETNLDKQQRNYVDKAYLSAEHLLGIIDDILDYSKIEAGKLQLDETLFTLSGVIANIQDLVKFKADEKDVRVSMQIDPELPDHFQGDPLRLGQILINLIGNSVKFSHNHGEVVVSVDKQEESEQFALLNFSIRDQGIGISDEQLKTLFHPFTQADSSTTRKYGGTGLGLVISKNLVEQMGGKIEVKSSENNGSTFSFSLRLKKQPTEKSVDPQPAITKGRQDLDETLKRLHASHILLVEDNEMNRELAVELLTKRGMTVATAGNGVEALERLAVEHFDGVLMDCQMPKMDGYETTRMLRKQEKFRNLPIIALTANAMKGDREKALAAGMDDYISKPIDIKIMLTTMAKWIKSE